MILPLDLRCQPGPAADELVITPSGWSVSPTGELIVNGLARAGTARRLSDLLTGIPGDGGTASAHLADVAAARAAVARGHNPVLYRAYRDVLPPRTTPGGHDLTSRAGTGSWFADLVIYQGGALPGGRELVRSVGHWNTPVQLEVFQCLRGRVLILSTTPARCGLTYQVCGPGDMAVMEFGAWHLTTVLSGPASVFNIYTDIDSLADEHTSRDAAQHDGLKYHSRAAVKIAVIRSGKGVALAGEPAQLSAYSPIRKASTPRWAHNLVDPGGLAALYRDAADTTLVELPRQALIHSQQLRLPLAAAGWRSPS